MPVRIRVRSGNHLIYRKVGAGLAQDQKFQVLALHHDGNDGVMDTRFDVDACEDHFGGWKARSACTVCFNDHQFGLGARCWIEASFDGKVPIL